MKEELRKAIGENNIAYVVANWPRDDEEAKVEVMNEIASGNKVAMLLALKAGEVAGFLEALHGNAEQPFTQAVAGNHLEMVRTIGDLTGADKTYLVSRGIAALHSLTHIIDSGIIEFLAENIPDDAEDLKTELGRIEAANIARASHVGPGTAPGAAHGVGMGGGAATVGIGAK